MDCSLPGSSVHGILHSEQWLRAKKADPLGSPHSSLHHSVAMSHSQKEDNDNTFNSNCDDKNDRQQKAPCEFRRNTSILLEGFIHLLVNKQMSGFRWAGIPNFQTPWIQWEQNGKLWFLISQAAYRSLGFPASSAGDTRDTGSIPGLGSSPEKGVATHSSILAWEIPWTEEPGGYIAHWVTKSQTQLSLARIRSEKWSMTIL